MADSQLTIPHLDQQDLVRLFSKIYVNKDRLFNGSPCWEWTASTNKGYAQFYWAGRQRQAYRITYAWLVAALPIGQRGGDLDHLCRNKRCVNPCHLELVSHRENSYRALSVRDACQKGHALTPDNIVPTTRPNRKWCLACKKVRDAKRATSPKQKAYMAKYNKEYRAKNRAALAEKDRIRNADPVRKANMKRWMEDWKSRQSSTESD